MEEFFDCIVDFALQKRASDIHLGVGFPPVARVDGKIVFVEKCSILTRKDLNAFIQEFLTEQQREILSRGREVDFSFSYQQRVRFRVNVYKESKGLQVALRIIPDTVLPLSKLGIPNNYLEVLKKLASEPYGLLLITGPTGSGKSTTLAGLVDYINTERQEHIITIEDPIEYLHESKKSLVKHREVGALQDTETFASGLRATLREDPDVILVGEMRDYETISLAVTAAETGHLVLSTLHTNNMYQAVNRIIDVFPPEQQNQIRGQLAQNLIGIIAQRLVPKIGGGRVIALEILINTSAVKTQIRDDKLQTIPSTIQTSRSEGMILLETYIQQLEDDHIIDRAVAARFITSQAAY